MSFDAYAIAEKQCIFAANPKDADHEEALRRAFRFGIKTIQPEAYGSNVTHRAKREDRRARREVRNQLCESYGVIPLFLIFSILGPLIQWALGKLFDWLWSRRSSETFVEMVSECKASIA